MKFLIQALYLVLGLRNFRFQKNENNLRLLELRLVQSPLCFVLEFFFVLE